MSKRPGTSTPARMTKAERKEAARKERLELLRKEARRKKQRRWGIGIAAVAIAGGITAGVLFAGGSSNKSSAQLAGILTSPAPWPANTQDLSERLNVLDLPAAGSAIHIHSLLHVYVHGQEEPLATNIGVSNQELAPLHTHDSSGIIHVESADRRSFDLGEFLDVWGVRLSQSCLGGYCVGGKDKLQAFVDGKRWTGRLGDIPLKDHEVIVLAFGTNGELPEPIPTKFSFSGQG
jgi:hypothetical protein